MSDWIKWKGGECPVSGDTVVEIEIETIARWEDRADQFSWEHIDDGCNIIAYRVVSQ